MTREFSELASYHAFVDKYKAFDFEKYFILSPAENQP